ncbi:MAG: type II toxin-antitoxin system HicB family antitoxin [Pseudodesulfovibrio sp.]|nr:type II toxin-antitoxin system HicB family antitoxin [Pseudodesulfovibrio sp.]
MATYFAVIHKDQDSDYGVSFPDLPGCITAGGTLAEVESMAREALAGHLEVMRDEGMDIPSPSDYAEVHAEYHQDDGFVAIVMETVPEKVKRVRFNVSFSELDLAVIDAAADAQGLDRSAYLAVAGKSMAQGKCAA